MVSPTRGRPKLENPKDTMIRVRMDKETIEKLDNCVKAFNTTRSDVIRKGIEKVEAEIKK